MEQPEMIQTETSPGTPASGPETFNAVFKQGLEGSETQPQTETQTSEPKSYAELVYDDKTRLAFKDEKHFNEFLENNKTLKEGFLRSSDYTRKTQDLAKQRKEIESYLKEQENFWGEVKPNQDSLKGFKTLWDAFQRGDDRYSQELYGLLTKANSIINGQAPTQEQPLSPEVLRLSEKVQQFEQIFNRMNLDKATNEWETWKGKKESQPGVKINEDIEQMMAHFLEYTDPKTGKPMSLDRAYDYSIRELGLENTDATKKVFREASSLKAKSPSAPNSAASSTANPEPRSFGEIFRQAANL
jgi:hypothetical protein